jgi:hypothetical protein
MSVLDVGYSQNSGIGPIAALVTLHHHTPTLEEEGVAANNGDEISQHRIFDDLLLLDTDSLLWPKANERMRRVGHAAVRHLRLERYLFLEDGYPEIDPQTIWSHWSCEMSESCDIVMTDVT